MLITTRVSSRLKKTDYACSMKYENYVNKPTVAYFHSSKITHITEVSSDFSRQERSILLHHFHCHRCIAIAELATWMSVTEQEHQTFTLNSVNFVRIWQK